jgi:peptidoglycan/LPS O-acetylase OafA/YrhL
VLLVAIYLAYSFISYQVMTSGSLPASLQWWPTFALLLPGATALALIPVLVGCEMSNQQTRKRNVPRRRTAFILFWAGALTYPVYLVHSSVLDAVAHGLPHANYAAKWLIGTILVVLIAWILHMTVERAALEWRKSHTARPEQAKATENPQDLNV